MPKQRSPDDVHDIFNVQVGRPYRGSMVEKIDLETTNLPSGKVKVRRLIHCDTGIILIEDTWHEYGDVFQDGKLLPYDQIQFPSMDPADFEAPVKKKVDDEDDEEKKKKRELLRQKAKNMLKKDNAPDNKNTIDELNIKVKTPDGRIIPVVVKKEDTVGDLHDKLEDDHDIPMDQHNLSHNGKPLDQPNATMDDCGIHNGDVVNLEPNDDELRLKVKTPDGSMIPVVVKKNDTVADLHDNLEDTHDIPMDDHELHRNGQPLDQPNASMEDSGVQDGDVLELEPKETTFAVRVRTPDGKKHMVDIHPNDTVLDLKKTIERDLDIPVQDQNLSCSGEPLEDPASTMTDNGISDGDILDLDIDDMTVNVRTSDGRRFSVPAKPYSTVKDVKKTIESTQGIPATDQNLSFEGKPLKDPSATMTDLGVSNGDTLDLDDTSEAKPRKPSGTQNGTASSTTPKGKDRKRVLNPDSAWVFPTKQSAPTEGEIDNLQGVWSMPPTKGSLTDPVEVNIHPLHKEPKSGKNEIHGPYGYINGAKPDADGVVDPAHVRFYPPKTKAKDFSPDFEHVGWWSAPESSSKTTVSWRFEGNDCYNVKTHTVNVMGHEMTFVKEWVE